MRLPTPDEIEKKTLLILRVLRDARQPLGARLIARQMADRGVTMSERTIRYHLRLMDERGLTKLAGRRDGRLVTKVGLDELGNARVRDKLGLAISRIEILAFKTTFDPKGRQGLLPVNISFFPKESFRKALEAMQPAFRAGLCVSDLVALAGAGEKLGEVTVPEGRIGLATVCSIVVNGVLLKNGIPMDSKFGGILQLSKGRPMRFVELIYYSGSSLDPSEAFIEARMTSVKEAAKRGEGRILANFREVPAPSRSLVESIIADLRKAGINSVLSIGEVGEPVCEVPVDLNKLGLILLGGLNPVCCAREAGIESENKAMSTVMNFEELMPFKSATAMKKHT
ncbi:MAG TPA: NrpR regulatory domain-containing protein [Syntrophales bacterium]|nr:NrpR regulatory domain-containing protein [Syntrophales bacterium]HOX95198.1 NrpR regulatory domain-containing protein [Syntrophales bacterium]HPI56290.1 NrpR regulatory domain-containing protein [Syntrophales bacterium]HPN24477.1 NrpR regulatory domain-containing protein [Syntrophales bacterium]HQM29107.1 NrpR regulatory domain-containing protein [Syntrophales bacterium]